MLKCLLCICMSLGAISTEPDECSADDPNKCPDSSALLQSVVNVHALDASQEKDNENKTWLTAVAQKVRAHKMYRSSSSPYPKLAAFFNAKNMDRALMAVFGGSGPGVCTTCDARDGFGEPPSENMDWKVCPTCDPAKPAETSIENELNGECVSCQATSSGQVPVRASRDKYDIVFDNGHAQFVSKETGKCLSCKSDGSIKFDSSNADGTQFKVLMRGIEYPAHSNPNLFFTIRIQNRYTDRFLWHDGASMSQCEGTSHKKLAYWMLFDAGKNDNTGYVVSVYDSGNGFEKHYLTYKNKADGGNGKAFLHKKYKDNASETKKSRQIWEFHAVGKRRTYICIIGTAHCLRDDDGKSMKVKETSCSSVDGCSELGKRNQMKIRVMAWPLE